MLAKISLNFYKIFLVSLQIFIKISFNFIKAHTNCTKFFSKTFSKLFSIFLQFSPKFTPNEWRRLLIDLFEKSLFPFRLFESIIEFITDTNFFNRKLPLFETEKATFSHNGFSKIKNRERQSRVKFNQSEASFSNFDQWKTVLFIYLYAPKARNWQI